MKSVQDELSKLKNPVKGKILSRFFKTGKGEYGEGDIFLGISVPKQREVAKKYIHLTLNELQELLSSKIHEHRLVALMILVIQYKKSEPLQKKKIVDFYLKNTANINNWDLVDLSSYHIIGDYFIDKNKNLLYELARSKSLWERRIAMISTYAFIRNNSFEDSLKIAEILINDKHDLIHKAVGWMLRELGKRSREKEEEFLSKHYKTMPRTMLRYAIEKFSEEQRRFYLNKTT